jgi:hypothetical protein
MHRSMIAAVAGLALAAVAQPAAAACQFVQLAELPVTMQGLRATIKVKINGHDSTLGRSSTRSRPRVRRTTP